MNRITIAVAALGGLLLAVVVLFVLGVGVDAGRRGRSFRNVSEAMTPTLFAGEYFTVRAVNPLEVGSIRRGTLVTHRFPPDPSKEFVKRIIAGPGDTIAMVNRQVRINGTPIVEAYAWYADTAADPVWDDFQWQREYLISSGRAHDTAYRPSRNNWGPLFVPADNWFVLGDNRDNSLDSRYWGFVPASDIEGVARRVYFSRDAKTGHIRWARLGTAVR